MARRPKELDTKTEPKKPIHWYDGLSQQDTFTMSYLWYTRKDTKAKCREAIAKIKKEDDLIKELINIAIESTSDKIPIYKETLIKYQKQTNWKAIIQKMKECMAEGE